MEVACGEDESEGAKKTHRRGRAGGDDCLLVITDWPRHSSSLTRSRWTEVSDVKSLSIFP